MRVDGMGVGDIGEVPGDARSAGDTADDDGGGAGRERTTLDCDAALVCTCVGSSTGWCKWRELVDLSLDNSFER
jgi:hypothetical protein